MKTLAQEVLSILGPEPMRLDAIAAKLGADKGSVRRAAESLSMTDRAVLIARSRSLHLASVAFAGHACKNCHREFLRARKSKRRCCNRTCSIAWSWNRPGVRGRRVSGILKERASPEAKARTAKLNRERWSRPGEREKMSEQNRREWSDPKKKAKRAAGIRAHHGSAQARKLYSDIRKAYWADPAKRQKMVDGIRKSKGAPEARAKFSRLLKARWADPEGRKIYLAGVQKTARKMSERNRGRKQSAEHVEKRVAATKARKAGKA